MRRGPIALLALLGWLAATAASGQGAKPGDLLVTEGAGGSIVNVRDLGDVSALPRFATGLDGPLSICRGPGDQLYATEVLSGEITIVTRGGDFTNAPPFAHNLDQPIDLLCTGDQILVSEFQTGEVHDVTSGGDVSLLQPFASGLIDGTPGPTGLLRDSAGTLWLSTSLLGSILDITGGGDFPVLVPFADGGGRTTTMAEYDGELLVSDTSDGRIVIFTAGGNLVASPGLTTLTGLDMLRHLPRVGLLATNNAGDLHEAVPGGVLEDRTPLATGLLPGGTFRGAVFVPGCGYEPRNDCIEATKASLTVSEKKTGSEKWKLSMKKFVSATDATSFGDPVDGDTFYEICVFDESDQPVEGLLVERAGEPCGAKGKPCWKAAGTKGVGYKDPDAEADGVRKISGRSGAPGKGKLLVQAGNKEKKGQDSLPAGVADRLAGQAGATVQVVHSSGACFSATLDDVKKNDASSFKARSS